MLWSIVFFDSVKNDDRQRLGLEALIAVPAGAGNA